MISKKHFPDQINNLSTIKFQNTNIHNIKNTLPSNLSGHVAMNNKSLELKKMLFIMGFIPNLFKSIMTSMVTTKIIIILNKLLIMEVSKMTSTILTIIHHQIYQIVQFQKVIALLIMKLTPTKIIILLDYPTRRVLVMIILYKVLLTMNQ